MVCLNRDNQSELDVIIVKADVGTTPLLPTQCKHHPNVLPLFEELQREMESRNWVTPEGHAKVDFVVGCGFDKDPKDGHYYFGMRAYRRCNPPEEEGPWLF